jgi:putative transposase
VIRFITEHKDHAELTPDGGRGLRWGVEPLCAVLAEHGIAIAPSTYYEWIGKAPTKRQQADAQLVAVIRAQREDKRTGRFVQTLGARKLWIRLRGQGHDVARCTVERIMREQGWEGACYGATRRTTIADPAHVRHPDLVDRDFVVPAPNRLWVADFSYVPTLDRDGRCRVRGRRVLPPDRGLAGGAVDDHQPGPGRPRARPVHPRAREGVADLTGLISHSDAGSQYTSVALTSRLIAEGIDPSVGSVGDALDNALAETHRGLIQERVDPPPRTLARRRSRRDRHR